MNALLCYISTQEGISPKEAGGKWDKSVAFLEKMMLKFVLKLILKKVHRN